MRIDDEQQRRWRDKLIVAPRHTPKPSEPIEPRDIIVAVALSAFAIFGFPAAVGLVLWWAQ